MLATSSNQNDTTLTLLSSFFIQKDVSYPEQCSVLLEGHLLQVKGPCGSIECDLRKIDPQGKIFLTHSQQTKHLSLYVKKDSSQAYAQMGSLLSFLKNLFDGICQGFLITLECVGVGYRAIVHTEKIIKNGKTLGEIQKIEFKIGQSHEIFFKVPSHIKVFSQKPTIFCLYGIEKQQVTQLAAQIRALAPPEPYKGKGIRFKDETIQLKEGKKK